MIRKIVEFALTKPLFVILGTVLFIGGGILAFKQLPVEAFPDVTDTQVTVIALFPGHAAEEVEKQITLPIESALAGLPLITLLPIPFRMSRRLIWLTPGLLSPMGQRRRYAIKVVQLRCRARGLSRHESARPDR